MVTTSTSSSSDAEEKPDAVLEGEGEPLQTPLTPQDPGFVGLLVQSIFEPGANKAVVLAMNFSFFFLVLTLFGLAIISNWNFHVLMLMGVSTCLWAAMIWFVMQLTAVQTNPENMPIIDPLLDSTPTVNDETRKDR